VHELNNIADGAASGSGAIVNNLISAGAAIAAAISFFVSTKPAPSQTLPVIPLHTSYSYWDHHWIQWLPGHPRYEAIEASIASNSDGTSQYMRVWLTERQPPKNQTFFFDDETQTRSVFGKSFARAIRYETSGGSGAPLGLDASFEDDEGRAVSWQLKFPPAERLSSQYAGLVPQGGHGEAGVQILWVLGPNATTFDSGVKIGAERFAVTPASVAAFGKKYGAAYTLGISGLIFPYGPSTVAARDGGFTDSWGGGRAFLPKAGDPTTFLTAPFGYKGVNQIELVTDPSGALASYRHRYAAHIARLDFAPPLPNKLDGHRGQYSVSIDGQPPILAGTVSGDATGLVLAPQSPQWATAMPLRAVIRPVDSGRYELRTMQAPR